MDTFRAANELANVIAAAGRAMEHMGKPPEEPSEGDRVEHLHYRAYKGAEVALDRAQQASTAIEKLEALERAA